MAGQRLPPVWHPQIHPPGNDRCPQGLIAHQSQIGTLNHRATFLASTSVWAVTMGTIRRVGRLAAFWITRFCPCGDSVRKAIGRESHAREGLWASPSGLHLVNQDVDLLVCQPATRARSEGWHGGAWHALRNDLSQAVFAHQRQIERVTERTRCSHLPITPMAPRTEAAVELTEVCDLRGENWPLRFCGFPGYPVAA